MKKLGLLVRENIVEAVKKRNEEAQGCFLFSFNKVNAFAFNVMRNNLRGAGALVFVARNSLLKKAFSSLGWEDNGSFTGAETAVVFVYDEDIVKACKVLAEFAKENEAFQIKGGVLKDKKLTAKEIIDLSKLPSKEVLLATAIGTIAAPLTGFLAAMNQVVLKFLWAVEEIKKGKEK
ncbi:MAG: 50S ribosomal protein L10 [Candidatus Omnitrophota bacterium]|nr:MAG: 50S ribosomal protein L10 [Candidatus Omnitrophota bacterium]